MSAFIGNTPNAGASAFSNLGNTQSYKLTTDYTKLPQAGDIIQINNEVVEKLVNGNEAKGILVAIDRETGMALVKHDGNAYFRVVDSVTNIQVGQSVYIDANTGWVIDTPATGSHRLGLAQTALMTITNYIYDATGKRVKQQFKGVGVNFNLTIPLLINVEPPVVSGVIGDADLLNIDKTLKQIEEERKKALAEAEKKAKEEAEALANAEREAKEKASAEEAKNKEKGGNK